MTNASPTNGLSAQPVNSQCDAKAAAIKNSP
jgi:hypothetical protein